MNLEAEHRRKLQELRDQQKDDLQKAQDRLENDTKVRLGRDRERERANVAGDNHELEDAKDQAQRESQ